MAVANKLTSVWFTARVVGFLDSFKGNDELSTLEGQVISSNFFEPQSYFKLPVIKVLQGAADEGDIVKITIFVHEEDLKKNDRSMSFKDKGMKYERLTEDGWSLIFEDFFDKGLD